MSGRMVVAGAVTSADGRLLLAQRRYPPEVAGLWELPGGKVEEGEDPAQALRRELREELDVDVEVGTRLERSVELAHDLTLVALWARIVGGEPRAVEHSRLRWVTVDELDEMAASGAIVPADTVWLPELSLRISGGAH
ncbi:(deoxy)nucleoside triphosphate pyrophosphohydrolase [Gordonia aichiensis]|uniref:8-oxo-dGTP diphosphatase n=1 Tax=Gordonia aichiensis NBRC 108223 TaxID=1220583 RepID=L7KIP0_9ACTN|nr:(deoxy)nucleoside triphosphate pyrophosphohydrolase [Gordonia aichiensis]GAC47563.1 putative NTP pyrophosphohydrolase [Gordonia aichiensis NBRC 108223]